MTANAVAIFFELAILFLIVVGGWLVFAKAGESGWQVLIPIWNVIVLLRIVGRPAWWVILLIFPLVGFIVSGFIAQDLAKSFGKGLGFAAGLWLLGFVFVPILGFGSATYRGPGISGPWGESLSGF
jgi:hypothetical protein